MGPFLLRAFLRDVRVSLIDDRQRAASDSDDSSTRGIRKRLRRRYFHSREVTHGTESTTFVVSRAGLFDVIDIVSIDMQPALKPTYPIPESQAAVFFAIGFGIVAARL